MEIDGIVFFPKGKGVENKDFAFVSVRLCGWRVGDGQSCVVIEAKEDDEERLQESDTPPSRRFM